MIAKIQEILDPPDSIIQSLETIMNDITIENFAEKGQNGFLFFGLNKIQNKKVAIKYYYYGSDTQYHSEPKYLTKCISDYILPIHHAELVCEEWALYITDYCSKGDLEDFIQNNSISIFNAINICLNLLKGLSTLHCNDLLHRDLKPQNILINDLNNPVIGDFGSVKHIPTGHKTIPGSGHSILYRPPESFLTNQYSINGDIYQIGIIFYQLLGGELSNNGLDYLRKSEKLKYNNIDDEVDKSIYIDQILRSVITRGKLLNLKSLPIWIDKKIIKIIRKAVDVNPTKRYQSCSLFMNDLLKVKRDTLDWQYDGKNLNVKKKKEYRIIKVSSDKYYLEKRKHSNWRKINFDTDKNLQQLIDIVNKDLK